MKILCGNLSSIYLLHIHFTLRTVTVALVVVYSTDSSSCSVTIEASRFLSVSSSCRVVGLGASVPRRGLWHGRTWAMAWQNQCRTVFKIISLNFVCFRNSQRIRYYYKNLESDKRMGRRVTNGWDHLRSTMGNSST